MRYILRFLSTNNLINLKILLLPIPSNELFCLNIKSNDYHITLTFYGQSGRSGRSFNKIPISFLLTKNNLALHYPC